MKSLNTPSSNRADTARVRTPGIQAGETIVTIHGHQVPRLPHERDESRSSQNGPHDEVVKQAARDIASGQRDTSMGPAMDATYHRVFHEQPHRVPARRKTSSGKRPAK